MSADWIRIDGGADMSGVSEDGKAQDQDTAHAILLAYAQNEGGYKSLARRFGVSFDKVRNTVRRAGMAPGVQVHQPKGHMADLSHIVGLPHVSHHARLRAWEHYGIHPSKKEWATIVRCLRDGDTTMLIKRTKTGGMVHAARIRRDGVDHLLLVVYLDNTIVTVLPSEAAAPQVGRKHA